MIPINKRNIGKCILLSFLTLGIYLIYWEYLLVKNTRAIKKDDSSCTGEMLCLIFVPFYSIYWCFTRGKSIHDEFLKHGYSSSSYGTAFLALFGLEIITIAIMQSDFNSLQAANTNTPIRYIDPESGKTVDLLKKTPLEIRELGVRLSFVPEDRLGMGLVGNMDITDNMMLRSYTQGHSFLLDRKPPKDLAERIIDELEVVTPGTTTPVRRLSGGNVQKVLVGREIAAAPTVLMAAYPVRGLDINSSYTIYNLLNQQKENGVAVIFVGEDLDVLIELCDRILVVGGGRVTGLVDARTTTKEEIGLLMTKTEGV